MANPTIDATYEPRLWRCEECRTLLGYVLRNSNRVRRLWILRVQRQDGAYILDKDLIIMAANSQRHDCQGLWSVRGIDSAQGVGCNTCGSLQAWHASEEAIVDLIRRLRGEEGVKKYRRYMHEYLG